MTDPETALDQAAREVGRTIRHTSRAAAPIDLWRRPDAAREWLQRVREVSIAPPAGAEKAAEWLLDNDYHVSRALKQIRKDLPQGYYAKLPTASLGGHTGPRIYLIAHEMLVADHLQLSLSGAVRFIRRVQEAAPLSIAELWAFPTMLRIAAVEILVASLEEIFDSPLAQPLALGPHAANPHSLDTSERVARAISVLRIVAEISWSDFFDSTSLTEELLGTDPSHAYLQMDFDTRDRCRRAVEQVALDAQIDERDVASAAIAMASNCKAEVERHVGYWLIDKGRSELETKLGAEIGSARLLSRKALAHPWLLYAGLGSCTWIGAMIAPAAYLHMSDASVLSWIGGLLIAFIPASILAMVVLNWSLTRILPPRTLPKMNFEKGLPANALTAIVVPVVLSQEDEVVPLIRQLESHWLANSDDHLQIVLLADLGDGPVEQLSTDEPVEAALIESINRLNAAYRGSGNEPFHLLMRPRRYNPAEGCWMAWERKRGKLEEFNRLVVMHDESAFSVRIGALDSLLQIRYVVTVDADTVLPSASVASLVGTIAHPLNRPCFDVESGLLERGHAIIQPRVEISPQSGESTIFARLFTGDTAIDIYSRAVSDVYQDLFGMGVFVGKGVYDLHAFHACLDGRVPENSILSHDLFEGLHCRAALATDIVLYENFPRSYPEYSRRLHRWIRGDWQLIPWLAPSVPAADGNRIANQLSAVDRWKILDNLRRSLVAPSLVLLAIAGWFVLPGSPWFWTFLVVLAQTGQLFVELVGGFARGRRKGGALGLRAKLYDQAGRALLATVFLLHEAYLSLHAIGTTLWRLGISRRHLLEWTSAARVASGMRDEKPHFRSWKEMWPSVVAALLIASVLGLVRPAAIPPALCLLLPWLLAPEIAHLITRVRKPRREVLSYDDEIFLRLLARRTWYYFETFAGPAENWLPPDNFQGLPHEEIAHRTSPTNIGMLLISTAAAWDLGFLGRAELAARSRNLLETLDQLEMYRGHFFNWYDTRTLQPLEPRYVSTVDSGNLAGALIVFAQALRDAKPDTGLDADNDNGIEPQRWAGLCDLLDLIVREASRLDKSLPLAQCARNLSARIGRDENGGIRDITELQALYNLEVKDLERQASEFVAAQEGGASETLRDLLGWLERLRHHTQAMLRDASVHLAANEELAELASRYEAMAWQMNFSWLYDSDRRLLVLGHNVSTSRTDNNFYDLLASEARLASYFAIAKQDVPVSHWFQLGRPVTKLDGQLTLLSWNGSMFEYLMPRLLLPTGANTLLGESERVAVELQRQYGRENDVPWGISESAYSARDASYRFQYRAFGVPQLGLRRGLAQDMVVAPYASALALTIAPASATRNLRQLDELGAGGRYGLWEAIDYTAERLREGESFTGVNAYMAHHQGMVFASIANKLNDDIFARRFMSDPRVAIPALLLSERIPDELPAEIERLESVEPPDRHAIPGAAMPSWQPGALPLPQVALLGNGSLSSWVSDAGGGVIHWHGQAITRFIADATCDADGSWIYVADRDSGRMWSATRQPVKTTPDEYGVIFEPYRAEFHRRDGGIDIRTEICVAGPDDMEIRRLTIRNESDRPRKLMLTSYAEMVLAPDREDERHPAFSKLFVGGDFRPEAGGLLFHRRARDPQETPPVVLIAAIDKSGPMTGLRHEVDRRAFIGRNRNTSDPVGASGRLGNSAGFTLDPVAALQFDCDLEAGESRQFCFLAIVAGSAPAAHAIAARHTSLGAIDGAIRRSADETLLALSRTGLDFADVPAIAALASPLIYPHAALRARRTASLQPGYGGQADLWGLGISGDLPILILRTGAEGLSLSATLAGAHQLWRRAGLSIDLVILQTGGSAYVEPLRGELDDILRDIGSGQMLGRSGGIHLLFADQIDPERLRSLEIAAAAILDEARGSLAAQLASAVRPARLAIPAIVASRADDGEQPAAMVRSPHLLLDNGIGGFTADGREYVMEIGSGVSTPAPWVNILANETFGTLASESGGGFTWAVNSGEHRLSRWSNDPVSDRPSEALYLRDEETTAVWSISPAPCHDEGPCRVRHGLGYTIWRKQTHGIEQEMQVFVPRGEPVKIVRLRLRNCSKRPRRLTATYYIEWLLGSLASADRHHVQCEYVPEAEALLASNSWRAEFADRVAFLTASRDLHGFTMDREEFMGTEGDIAMPASMRRWGLSSEAAAGSDPCAAYQVHLEIPPDEWSETVFVLGEATGRDEAVELARAWRDPAKVPEAESGLAEYWDEICAALTIRTPDPAFDLMVNRWLLYQSLSSRVFGRTGFYQASGAIGFRDQLQDVLALLHVQPDLVRAHILDCAAHQFEEGDVLHWWHPPAGRGVRTRFSDDLHWLAYAVGTYVKATGDDAILLEPVDFLSAPPLSAHESDRYDRFGKAEEPAPLIDHCERALDRITTGAHGLPLMGSGDWNDGMDRVGKEGRGESVWLAWFASVTMSLHAEMLTRLDRPDAARYWTERAEALREAALERGWDGSWFRRAYDDHGRALGSAEQAECRIDSIAQSWAQFACGSNERTAAALRSASQHLVDSEARLARLLWPPFDVGLHDPGYIAAYPPGVRENGGQYNHAAAWLGLAMAEIGDGESAYDILKMISPLHRVRTPEDAALYRLEPYAVAGDICTAGEHRGRGGWSWYTGAAAWTWRLATEGILGLRMVDGRLRIQPCLPEDWPGFSARLVRSGGVMDLTVEVSEDISQTVVELDGQKIEGCEIDLPADGASVSVLVRVPSRFDSGYQLSPRQRSTDSVRTI